MECKAPEEHLLGRPANLTKNGIQFVKGRIRESIYLFCKEFQIKLLRTDINQHLHRADLLEEKLSREQRAEDNVQRSRKQK